MLLHCACKTWQNIANKKNKHIILYYKNQKKGFLKSKFYELKYLRNIRVKKIYIWFSCLLDTNAEGTFLPGAIPDKLNILERERDR